ncbi:hypothetical protein BHM03_00054826, partial [Ensete ventricosum]
MSVRSWSSVGWVEPRGLAREVGCWNSGAQVGLEYSSSGRPLTPARRSGRVGSRRDPSDGHLYLISLLPLFLTISSYLSTTLVVLVVTHAPARDLAERVNSGTNPGDLAERANSGTNPGDLAKRVNSGSNPGDLAERTNSGSNLGDLAERMKRRSSRGDFSTLNWRGSSTRSPRRSCWPEPPRKWFWANTFKWR